MNATTFPRSLLAPDAVPLTLGGTHRGGRAVIDRLAELTRSGFPGNLSLTLVDPMLGRAASLALQAESLGLTATPIEGRVEEHLAVNQTLERGVIVLALDRADAIARALLVESTLQCPVFCYLLLKLPNGPTYGLSVLLRPGDVESRRLAVHLFTKLGEFTAQTGAARIIGAEAELADQAREPLLRAAFARHLGENLARVIAGVTPESYPFEMTDGFRSMPLFVRLGDAWQSPTELAATFVRELTAPLLPGDFILAEVTPAGIRFHLSRLRERDRRVTVRGTAALDEAAIAELAAAERERFERETARALALATRETITLTSPAETTD